jgi:hypothetical protein
MSEVRLCRTEDCPRRDTCRRKTEKYSKGQKYLDGKLKTGNYQGSGIECDAYLAPGELDIVAWSEGYEGEYNGK